MSIHDLVPIILWALLIGAFAVAILGGLRGKKKYAGRSMEVDKDWLEKSRSLLSNDDTIKAYFFHFDKNYLQQGYQMENRNHAVVYDAKMLYGDPVRGYEFDLTNHLIGYTHHHKLSASVTSGVEGGDGVSAGITTYSTFKFDGTDVWEYLESLGYKHHFEHYKLAYTYTISRNGEKAGTIYSSNNGKNYFNCDGPIEPKMGNDGLYVVECPDKEMDILFLYAMVITRTEFSLQDMKN